MKFPNAAKGIKKIFNAEILNLIALIATSILLILSVVLASLTESDNDATMGVLAISILVFGAVAGVMGIIALILMIVGTIQTAKDEPSFKMIIYLAVLNIIVAIIAALFSGNQFVNNLANGFNSVVSFITSILVVIGVANLARQLLNTELAEKCAKLLRVIIWVGMLSLMTRFFSIFWGSKVALVIIIFLGVISIILSIIQYILYLSMLSKAKKILAKS
ncbi:MAG: hypothetical protein UH734_02395 [Ruminococcus sp.]|nr:hypothetical protein [Ruminococcus sp.]